jgi:phospholipase/carboxylesterase
MNRLPSPKALGFEISSALKSPAKNTQPSALAATSASRRRRERTSVPCYALFAPLHYERGYAYPLLVWLHGDGGSERELRRLMPHISLRNYVAAAPRGDVIADGRAGHAWMPFARAAGEAAERVHECIEASKRRFNVHARRVFIAGCGSGGTMALRLALRFPEWFAGAISLGGPMPHGGCPLNRINEARRLPLLLASCRDSREYPQDAVAADLRLLHAGGFSLSLRQYPGEEALTTVMLADVDRWLMEQVCPSTVKTTA